MGPAVWLSIHPSSFANGFFAVKLAVESVEDDSVPAHKLFDQSFTASNGVCIRSVVNEFSNKNLVCCHIEIVTLTVWCRPNIYWTTNIIFLEDGKLYTVHD